MRCTMESFSLAFASLSQCRSLWNVFPAFFDVLSLGARDSVLIHKLFSNLLILSWLDFPNTWLYLVLINNFPFFFHLASCNRNAWVVQAIKELLNVMDTCFQLDHSYVFFIDFYAFIQSTNAFASACLIILIAFFLFLLPSRHFSSFYQLIYKFLLRSW